MAHHPGSRRETTKVFPLASCSMAIPSATPLDYARAESWETLPSASQAVDVFFVHPTTYSAPTGSLDTGCIVTYNTQAYAGTGRRRLER